MYMCVYRHMGFLCFLEAESSFSVCSSLKSTTHCWRSAEQQACILLANVSVCFTVSQQHKNKSASVCMCVSVCCYHEGSSV